MLKCKFVFLSVAHDMEKNGTRENTETYFQTFYEETAAGQYIPRNLYVELGIYSFFFFVVVCIYQLLFSLLSKCIFNKKLVFLIESEFLRSVSFCVFPVAIWFVKYFVVGDFTFNCFLEMFFFAYCFVINANQKKQIFF